MQTLEIIIIIFIYFYFLYINLFASLHRRLIRHGGVEDGAKGEAGV